jgi:hypothetical protein
MRRDREPTEKERIDELFIDLEITDALLEQEELEGDEITDFTEAGFCPW